MKEKNSHEHLALYRKYRPADFKDVLGQEHIIDVLMGSIKNEAISHAYLFCGTRGTGKTSVARIFAREVGCSANDLYEIDAASNTGVDDIRTLTESVNTLPFDSKYKIYILDEVHMLSKSAFNALLKTLEEPPKHVIFILATTEPEKLPETVVSRCQMFVFKKPTQKILKDLIMKVAKKEGCLIESSSAELISLLADGSYRDAYGILQKILSFSPDKKISVEEIERVTGAPRSGVVNKLITAIQDCDVAGGLGAVKEVSGANVDAKVFFKLLLQKIRYILLLRNAPDMAKEISEDVSEADFAFLKEFAQKNDLRITSAVLLELLSAYDFVGRSYIAELPLELAIIKLCQKDA